MYPIMCTFCARKAKNPGRGKGKKAADGELCRCGCGETCAPGKKFKQGHDARFHGRVKKIKAGILKIADLPKLGVKDYALKFYRSEE